ncbi:DUF6701 domain-containing protein [Pseudoalteromonas sp. SSDWG2]|uniref:DUF6701 domain-containing protein n=1 Tax=Pseudoalteromonas sp. SSDWG2 TaxID=3139391 RepID=UPI003BAB51E7
MVNLKVITCPALRLFSVSTTLCLLMFAHSVSFAAPVAIWPMNEVQWTGSANEVIDISGNELLGTPSSGISTINSISCRGGNFNAQGYVRVPDSPLLSPLLLTGAAEMSIAGWMKVDDTSANGVVFYKGDGANNHEYSMRTQDGIVYLTVWDGSNTAYQLVSNVIVLQGQWYYFVVQNYLRNNGNTTLSLQFYNQGGSQITSISGTVRTDYAGATTPGDFYIGAQNNNGVVGDFFAGALDNLHFYNSLFTSAEISAIYNDTGACAPEVLLAHYPLDLCQNVDSGVIEDVTRNYPAQAINIGASTGVVGQAGDFRSASLDYVDVPADLFNGLTDFTVSLWARAEASTNFNDFISASNNTTSSELEIYVRPDDTVRVALKGVFYKFVNPTPLYLRQQWTHFALTRQGKRLCLFVDTVRSQCISVSDSALVVQRAALGIWWLSDGTFTDELIGDLDEVQVFSYAFSNSGINDIYQSHIQGLNWDGDIRLDECSQCFGDDFESSVLEEQWVTYRSNGDFIPQIVNNRLRLTEAVTSQATSVNFKRLFPARDNLVRIEFDYYAYGGDGADGVAVVLSDASVTPQPGAPGGPLGYGYSVRPENNSPGFNGGWLGIGLDEYGNYSYEGGDNSKPSGRPQSVVLRGSGNGYSGYRYLKGTCNDGQSSGAFPCLSPAVDGTGSTVAHRYRIELDSRVANQTIVSISRDSGSGYETLIAPFNVLESQYQQAPTPENLLLSFTGSTGGLTNFHEVDNVKVCALLSYPLEERVDHFRLYHQAQTVRCLSSDIQIQACADAQCATLFTDPVDVQLGTTLGSFIGGNVVSLNNGIGNANLQATQSGIAQIGVIESSPPATAFSQTQCFIGATPSASCEIEFIDAGLAFVAADGGTSLANMRAGEEQNMLLRAIRTDDATGACEARVQGEQTLSFAMSCENPGACQASSASTINDISIGKNAQGQSSNRVNMAVQFDAQGQAELRFNYNDVGLIQTYATLDLPQTTDQPAITLNVTSNAFVSQPYSLEVTRVFDSLGGANPATQGVGSGFLAAAEPFTVQVSSFNAQQQLTPNFGLETPSQKASVQLDSLIYPSPNLASTADLNAGSFSLTATLGLQQSDTVSWHEAGSITIKAVPQGNTYLGYPYIGLSPHSEVIGRFYPDHFFLANSALVNACPALSYMGQDSINVDWLAQARGADGDVLLNYGANYVGAATLGYVARNLAPEQPQTNLENRLSIALGSWLQGEYQVNDVNAQFSRLGGAQTDGPYALLQVGLQVLSEADNRDWLDKDMVTDSVAACTDCTAKSLAGTLDVRYGRLALENSYGNEFEPLQVPMQSEYWQGSTWALSNTDNCTVYDANLLEEASGDLLLSGSGVFSGGSYGSSSGMNADSQDIVGDYPVSYPAPSWLLWDWDQDGNADNNPEAVLRFGSFRGNDSVINKRERNN